MLTRLILTGFMGSGKSTVGRLLASQLRWTFIDLDTAIEQRAHQTVPEIFAQHGEPHFRTLEAEALAEALQSTNLVIALGGGAPELLANRELLASTPDAAIVYLAAPFATLYDRCVQQATDPAATARPNLATHDSAITRFTHREPLYNSLATHTIESATLTPEETVATILQDCSLSPAP